MPKCKVTVFVPDKEILGEVVESLSEDEKNTIYDYISLMKELDEVRRDVIEIIVLKALE